MHVYFFGALEPKWHVVFLYGCCQQFSLCRQSDTENLIKKIIHYFLYKFYLTSIYINLAYLKKLITTKTISFLNLIVTLAGMGSRIITIGTKTSRPVPFRS